MRRSPLTVDLQSAACVDDAADRQTKVKDQGGTQMHAAMIRALIVLCLARRDSRSGNE